MHRLPAREAEQEGEDPAQEEGHHRAYRVQLDVSLGLEADGQAGGVAGAHLARDMVGLDAQRATRALVDVSCERRHGCKVCHGDPLFDDDLSGHHVVSRAAELVTDDLVGAGRFWRDREDVVVAGDDLKVHVERLEREPVLQVGR